MSFDAAATSADVLGAVTLLALSGVLEPPAAHLLKHRLASSAALCWLWDALLAPLLRAAAVAGFVLLAYPALFGLRQAPGVGILLAQESTRAMQLVNVLFAASLLLPLAPPLRRRPGLVVTGQGLIATAMVFHWYTAYLGATSSGPWPGTGTAALVAATALVSNQLAEHGGRRLGVALDAVHGTRGFDRLVPGTAAMLALAPPVLVYGYALGLQIAI